ncbi:hypothetical protein CFP56_019606 [Quercus suber]|uniref:Uncharacterized protein n=1 Tax=Quercus suber TaxID=58331 RepID=A0AAW0KGB4_QUESU
MLNEDKKPAGEEQSIGLFNLDPRPAFVKSVDFIMSKQHFSPKKKEKEEEQRVSITKPIIIKYEIFQKPGPISH